MPLTDTAIRAAKPDTKPRKLSDEKGLFLLIQPSGGKLWRFKYRHLGKEKKLSLGRYPDVTLKEARERRDDARRLIGTGVDPSAEKRALRHVAHDKASNTFLVVANEYIDKVQREGRSDATVGKARWLLGLMEPTLGRLPVSDITPAELLSTLRRVEGRGHLETANRMRSLASRVFRYAIATARATGDPAAALRGALVSPKPKHHAAIIDPKGVGALLRAINGYEGQPMTRLALKLAPLVYVRPQELRKAEWAEFDLDAAVWRIPHDVLPKALPVITGVRGWYGASLGGVAQPAWQHRRASARQHRYAGARGCSRRARAAAPTGHGRATRTASR